MELFNGISEKNKSKLLYTMEAHTFTFSKNTSILSTIWEPNMLGFIVSGYAQIIRTDFNGRVTIIEELEEDSVFGTIFSSLLNNEYDIITKEDTTLVLLDYKEVIDNDFTSPTYNQFMRNLLMISTDKIMEKNARIEILTKKTIREKLLEYFRIMEKKNKSKIIYLTLNYTELADYLAVDRCAMSRELKYLKEEGFIKCENRRIHLLY